MSCSCVRHPPEWLKFKINNFYLDQAQLRAPVRALEWPKSSLMEIINRHSTTRNFNKQLRQQLKAHER